MDFKVPKPMKEKSFRKHSLQEKTAASVLLKLFKQEKVRTRKG